MNIPINERVAVDVLAHLNTIKRAGGYSTDLAPRRPQMGESIVPLSGQNVAWLIGDIAQRLPTASYDQTGREEDFLIAIFLNSDESVNQPADTVINAVAADVEKALTLERASRTRGGLAQSTEWINTLRSTRTPMPGLLMRFRVRYITQFNNPTKSAYSNIP